MYVKQTTQSNFVANKVNWTLLSPGVDYTAYNYINAAFALIILKCSYILPDITLHCMLYIMPSHSYVDIKCNS